MATNRRKFLELLALGVPATTGAVRQGLPSTIQGRRDSRDEEEFLYSLDLISGVRQRVWDADVSINVIRHAPSDCPPGKIRWAIGVEEPDGSSKSILDRHPRVLLVYDKSLQVLYGICLEQAGCRVEAASDINAAMRLYCEHGPYDIVLTDLPRYRYLLTRIRERNPKQALAVVGACCTLAVRFGAKIPVLREGFRQEQLIRLVESAIKPRVRIMLAVADPARERRLNPRLYRAAGPRREGHTSPQDLVDDGHSGSFEIELETDGNEALRRYSERGPYDMVLADFCLPGLDGSELALAIRRENPQQRITIITDLASVRPSIRQKLGDVPVLKLKNLDKIKAWELPHSDDPDRGTGHRLLDRVEAGLALQNRRGKALRTMEA